MLLGHELVAYKHGYVLINVVFAPVFLSGTSAVTRGGIEEHRKLSHRSAISAEDDSKDGERERNELS